ncbi:MAG: chorismate mutase [Candidatus Izemoplasmatales bacterium]
MDIKVLRDQIDQIDEQMANLFVKRMEIVKEVAEYKMSQDLTVYDHTRELEVIEKNLARIEDPIYKEYYLEVITNLMKVSKEYQKYLILRSTL